MGKKQPTKSGYLYYIAGTLLVFDWLFIWFAGDPALQVLWYLGWIILIVGIVLIFLPLFILPRKGKVPEGKDITHTTIIVDTGIYAIIRHPLYLGWILIYLGCILCGQHWLIVISGIAGMACVYLISKQEDRRLVERFSDNYKDYMQKVPRINFLTGVIRLIQNRKNEKGKEQNF